MLAVSVVVMPTVRAVAAPPRVPVILDTDIFSSADDVGALADRSSPTTSRARPTSSRSVSTLATTDPRSPPTRGSASPRSRSSTATRTCRSARTCPTTGRHRAIDFVGPCAADASPNTPAPSPAVQVYRKALASQPNGSVVIVCTGYEENIDDLLNSSPDSISPLSGKALVAQKVKELGDDGWRLSEPDG